MKLFIQPNDVLFFRDGRPFDAGGDHVGRLAFPPNPLTFYGAIRAALIGQHGSSFQEFKNDVHTGELRTVAGDKDTAGSLKIVDFGLAYEDTGKKLTRLFPVPLDLVQEKGSESNTVRYFVLGPERKGDGIAVNFPHDDLLLLGNRETEEKFITHPSDYLNEEGFSEYLANGTIAESHFKRTDRVFKSEYRVGIERNTASHTAEEGQLYTVEFARLQEDMGFALELDEMNALSDSFLNAKLSVLRLGGEARSARYSSAEWRKPTPLSTIDGRFKLVLLTPAIFENGWIPDGIVPTGLKGTICKCDAKLVAAAVGRPTSVGGWDILKNDSKPTRRAVPAGSVYFFECTGDRKSPELEPNGFIHVGQSDFTKQGLGQAIITNWNYTGD